MCFFLMLLTSFEVLNSIATKHQVRRYNNSKNIFFISKNNSWYHQIGLIIFWSVRNSIFWYLKFFSGISNLWYKNHFEYLMSKSHFLISTNLILDTRNDFLMSDILLTNQKMDGIKKSNFWYQKIILLILKTQFLISENTSKNLKRRPIHKARDSDTLQ